jgi:uncharacterized protein
MTVEGEGRDQRLHFRTNIDDEVTVDQEHPLRFETEEGTDGLKPYVLVRGRLEALVNRPIFYDLVDAGTVERSTARTGSGSGRRAFLAHGARRRDRADAR